MYTENGAYCNMPSWLQFSGKRCNSFLNWYGTGTGVITLVQFIKDWYKDIMNLFVIFLDFYNIYFWFFTNTGTVHRVFELSEFICSFWTIHKSIFCVLYIKMFTISWTIHCPNLVILGDLFLFLRAGLVKVRNCQKNRKPAKTLFSEPEIQKFIENHRKLQKWKTNYANAQDDIIYMTV